MVKYAREPADAEKSAKARASDLRISFKNMRETCMMLKGMQLEAAQQYLKDVVAMKRCVVFRRFCGGVGRTAQAKNEGSTNGQGRWPKKCAEALLGLLENAKSNAEVRVDCETLERTHRVASRLMACDRRAS
jgi:large subunit ribosomal protein L17e